MKRSWDRTVLTVNFWEGTEPQSGDGLRTTTGRQYLILTVLRKRTGALKALECLVLPETERIPGTVFEWRWSPRKGTRRAGRRAGP